LNSGLGQIFTLNNDRKVKLKTLQSIGFSIVNGQDLRCAD
jgi:hypothetical protein